MTTYNHGLVSFMLSAWINFAIAFIFTYTFYWDRINRQASKLATELNLNIQSPPQETERKYYILSILILSVLLLPTVLKKPILKNIAEKRQEVNIAIRNALKVKLSIEYDDKTLNLIIPSSYFVNFKRKMQIKFLNLESTAPYITATLPNFAPHYEPALAVSRKTKERLKGYTILPAKFENADPNINTDASIISFTNDQNNKIDLKKIEYMLKGMNTDYLEKKNEYGLNIWSGQISYLHSIPNSLFAYPENEDDQNLYITCDYNLCAISISSENLPNFDIFIKKTQMSNWKQISEKAIELIHSFENNDKGSEIYKTIQLKL